MVLEIGVNGGLNMTHEDFKTCLEELDGQGAKTLAEKNARYSSSDDALHNFKMGAEVMGGTPAQACWGYMTKHLVALRDMIQRNDFSNREDVLEKIQDSINYLRFIWAISEEERSKYTSDCQSANVKTPEGYGECDSCLYADKTGYEEPCANCRNNFINITSEYCHAPLMWTPKANN